MIKKHLIALFINTGESGSPTWTRIKKSNELTITMNAETEDIDYIADESPTTELSKYKPTIEQPLKMIENEPDFKYFWNKFYDAATGEDAKTDYLILFMFDKTGSGETAKYKAWKGRTLISFDNLNAVDSQLTFTLNFGGTIEKGTATATGTAPDYTPVFTAAAGDK